MISSFQTDEELISLYNQTRSIFAKAGFYLWSWGLTNEVLKEYLTKDKVLDKDYVVKVLGMKWNVKEDSITFALNLASTKTSQKEK